MIEGGFFFVLEIGAGGVEPEEVEVEDDVFAGDGRAVVFDQAGQGEGVQAVHREIGEPVGAGELVEAAGEGLIGSDIRAPHHRVADD